MIYLDNAATTWPKPEKVVQSMQFFLEKVGANPGRSGHKMSLKANEIVESARKLLSQMFNINKPERVVFTLNATDSLNIAIKGLVKKGDHIITSSMEHNSVTRPLHVLSSEDKIQVTKVACDKSGAIDVSDIEDALQSNTKAVIILHASNVTGTLMPVNEIGEFTRKNNIYFIIDAAQTAGVFDIDMNKSNIDLLAMPGHKGLMGPPGTGVLIIGENTDVEPIRQGGTGSYSDVPVQPDVLPEKLESGTLNTVGIAGLEAGLRWIQEIGMEKIREHELNILSKFLADAKKIPGLYMYGPKNANLQAPVISFLLEGKNSTDVGGFLSKQYGIACRAGLHCAPDAHRTIGTYNDKLVRFGFSYFNTFEEIDYALEVLDKIDQSKSIPVDEGCGC